MIRCILFTLILSKEIDHMKSTVARNMLGAASDMIISKQSFISPRGYDPVYIFFGINKLDNFVGGVRSGTIVELIGGNCSKLTQVINVHQLEACKNDLL
jgi:hypothetical protein